MSNILLLLKPSSNIVPDETEDLLKQDYAWPHQYPH